MLSLYGAHFSRFCITIFCVNSLYGVFRRFIGKLYPKEEKRFTAQIWGSGAIPSYCTIFPVFHCLYCTTNRCSPSRTGALFSGQNSGIVQAAEVPLFSPEYNATDTAVILSAEHPPVPLRLRHHPVLASLPAPTRLPVTTRL